jgi:hypothetical protein
MLAALTSGFIAITALAASIYNVYLQRRQIEAQVWPHLEWMYSGGEDFTFDLANSGVGPARILGLRVTVKDKPVKTWQQALDEASRLDPELKALMANPDVDWGTSSIYGRVLGAGVTIHPIHFRWSGKEAQPRPSWTPLVRLSGELDVSICYCSTLDECEMKGRPVKECPEEQLTFEQ